MEYDQTKPVFVLAAHAQSKFGCQIDKFNGIFYKNKEAKKESKKRKQILK